MMAIFIIKDRRRFPRFNCSHLASYTRFDEEGRQCEEEKVKTVDLSPEGLRIQAYSPIPANEVLDLTVAIREELFNARGKVIRCESSAGGKFNVGIAFLDVDENNRRILYDYFREILGGGE
ncbi:MAG: PilZ domain-containing protein [Deltaproteobacteria bacterium]|nr:PilZ domain-containing protein [Deltaproteobacteria bacterium]